MKNTLIPKISVLLLSLIATSIFIVSCSDDAFEEPLSSDAVIVSFMFADLNPEVTASIDGTNINASVPFSTDLTSLVPTIELSEGATVSPQSGTSQDFSSPVTYVVTAEDGVGFSTYTVSISKDDPTGVNITPVWERNLASGGLPSWFSPNNDREIAVHGNYVYVHNNNDRLRVVSSADGSDVSVGEADFIDGRENFSSGNLFLLGVDTDTEGRILASNLRVGSDSQFPWYVYKWENKDATQELLINYPTPAGIRLGENIAVTGNIAESAAIFVPTSGFGTPNNKILKFSISGGEANNTPTVIELQGLENLGNAPDVYPFNKQSDGNLIVAGTAVGGIAEYTQAGALVGKLPSSINEGVGALLFSFALDVAAFELNGRKLLAATATDFTENAADAGFIYIVDFTDGLDNVTLDDIYRYALTPDGNIDTNLNGTGGVNVVVGENEATVYAMLTNFGIGAYTVKFE